MEINAFISNIIITLFYGVKTTGDAPMAGIMFPDDIHDMKQCVGIGPT